MSPSHLVIRSDGPVEHVALNRPDVRNALNEELIADLTAWAQGLSERRSIRVAILSGAGASFCAGADIAWMARTLAYSEDENLRDAAAIARMFRALDNVPVPLVGRIQGGAIGGGAGLAAVCDVVVAEEQAVFGFTEVKLGIIPAIIAPFVLAKIGASAARELFLTGARFQAGRAREIGLVHAVVPSSSLDDAIAAYVNEILSAGPEAVASAKALIAQVRQHQQGDAVDAVTSRAIAARRVSVEGQEGLQAFLHKRKPGWSTR